MMTMIRRWRDHDNERPFEATIRLDPNDPVMPRKPTNLPEPVIGPPIGRDHETLALEAIDLTPLQAYWAAHRLLGPGYASTWAAWVAQTRRITYLRRLHEQGLS